MEDGYFSTVGKFDEAISNVYYGYLSVDELSTQERMNWLGVKRKKWDFCYLRPETSVLVSDLGDYQRLTADTHDAK